MDGVCCEGAFEGGGCTISTTLGLLDKQRKRLQRQEQEFPSGIDNLVQVSVTRYVTAITQPNRFSAAFQLTTSQTALKYSALRFWYCKLQEVSIRQ